MTRRGARVALAIALVTLVYGLGVPAGQAYVRTRTLDGNNPIHWTRSCVFITPSTERAGTLTQTEILTAVHASADAWNAVSCSYIQLVVGASEPGLEAGFNEDVAPENVIVFQDATWPYDPVAAALTTITYLSSSSASSDGQIVDADIEVNGVNFVFATNGSPTAHDLQNVLTHEIGHVLGLDHPCDDGMVTPIPLDHTGTPIPWCFPRGQLPPEVTGATMYNFAEPGEMLKRTLEPDDVNGLCAIYPTAADPNVCEPVPPIYSQPTCNCTSRTVSPGDALPWLLVLGLLLLYRFRSSLRERSSARTRPSRPA